MAGMYGFEKGNIPDSYRPLNWTERKERTASDYGPPPYGKKPYPGYDPNNLNELETPEPELAEQKRLEKVEEDLINFNDTYDI